MIQYPQVYSVSSHSEPGISSRWTTQAHALSDEETVCAIPPEFEGPGGGFSPEDLYAMALLNCFVATFKVFAEKSRIVFAEIRARGDLTVDRDDKGVPWMSKIGVHVQVSGAADPDRVRTVLEKTSRSCLILNSVRTEKTFEWEVTA